MMRFRLRKNIYPQTKQYTELQNSHNQHLLKYNEKGADPDAWKIKLSFKAAPGYRAVLNP